MYNALIKILIILAILATICICTIKPQMHNTVMVYDSNYTIVPTKEIEIEQQNIPVMEQQITPQTTVIKTEEKIKPQTTTVKVQPVKITQTSKPIQKNVITKTQPIKATQTSFKTTTTNVIQQPKIDTQKIISNNQKIQQEKQNPTMSLVPQTIKTTTATMPVAKTSVSQAPKPVTTSVKTVEPVKVQTTPKPKVLTAREEEIAWNIWRSNLQNKIMQDTKLPYIPMGTIFRFSFDVDKYGKISNIQTWSDTPKYTPHAIQFVAPIIRSYQGRSILNFPAGTNRTSTKFVGAWKISTSSKYSTPQDYNDIERIKR